MIILFSRDFVKNHKKLDTKIKEMFQKKLELFAIDEFNQKLANHGLKGSYVGVRSISVTGDFRAHYLIHNSETRLFIDIGTYSQLYKK